MIDTLHFIRPWWLVLAPLGIACTWYIFRHFRDQSNWSGICDPHLARLLLVSRGEKYSRVPLIGACIMWLLAAFALAGPAWEKLPQPLEESATGRVLVLDLSRSMDSTDLKPSRLERARYRLIDMIQRTAGTQQGLVAFAGDAFVVSPLTDDKDTLLNLVPALETASMPVQGSRSDLGLAQAVDLLVNTGLKYGNIVLITDGVTDNTTEIAAEAFASGYSVSVLGVGTPGGGPIPLPNGSFLKDTSGNIVVPGLDERRLERVATAGSGRYARLSATGKDLELLVTGNSPGGLSLTSGDGDDANLPRSEQWADLGPWLLFPLLFGAALAFRRGWAMVFVLGLTPLFPDDASGFEWQDLWARQDQQAMTQFQQGEFGAVDEDAPADWRGAARYRSNDFEAALQSWSDLDPNDPATHYNRGNALARMNRLSEAVSAYDHALALDPEHDDALFNRELVKQAMAAQQQTENDSGDSGDENSGNEDQEQKEGGQQGSGEREEEDDDSASEPAQEGNSAQNRNRADSNESSDPGDKPENEEFEQSRNENRDTLVDADTAGDSLTEQEQALEQWLKKVPDDPGGLLRRKFRYQYSLREPPEKVEPW